MAKMLVLSWADSVEEHKGADVDLIAKVDGFGRFAFFRTDGFSFGGYTVSDESDALYMFYGFLLRNVGNVVEVDLVDWLNTAFFNLSELAGRVKALEEEIALYEEMGDAEYMGYEVGGRGWLYTADFLSKLLLVMNRRRLKEFDKEVGDVKFVSYAGKWQHDDGLLLDSSKRIGIAFNGELFYFDTQGAGIYSDRDYWYALTSLWAKCVNYIKLNKVIDKYVYGIEGISLMGGEER